MNKNNQSRTIVTSKYIFVFVGAVILLTVIVWKHNYDLRILKQEYISANNIQVTKVANSIEDNFKLFKQGLQTIAHLPDVKDINEDGSNVGSNAKISIQEIYNALAANITVSEIYITTSHLGEHDEKNLVFNNVHSPVLSFDNEMDGSFHDDSSELEEYKLIASQTAWANKYFPEYLEHNEKQFVSGPEVQICDSRTIPDVKRSKEKNKGIVLSTPFYGSDNKLRGMVSGIIQSDVVRKMLPDKYLYLVNKTYGYSIGLRNEKNYQPDKELLMNALPDNALIYSNVMRVHLPDKSSEWYLWVGYPDSLFWEQNMVKSDNKFLALTLTMIVLFCFFLVAYVKSVSTRKVRLENEVLRRTKELKEEIGLHNGTILELKNAKQHLTRLLDDSEKKRDEVDGELVEKESHIKAIFETAIDAIITITPQGIIRDCNPAVEKITGYTPEELVGNNITLIMPKKEADEHDTYLSDFGKTGKSKIIGVGREVKVRHRDGHDVSADLAITVMETGGKTYYVGVLRDVTEHHKMINIVEDARDSALESSRIKSEFLSNVSHELRTPMNGIIGFAQLLEDTKLDDEQRAYLDTIMDSANGLMSIINDVLDFTRLGAGKIRIENTDFNLRMTIDSVIDFFKLQTESAGIKLQTQISSKTPIKLIGPPGRLRQILVNLISNAIKYTEHGEVNVRVNVLEEHEDDLLIIIEVEDTGIGIDEESQKLIFDSFRQVDGSITRSNNGLGLGLAITKSLIEMIGGEIGVKSIPGEGSTFWFTMQLNKAELTSVEIGSISSLKDKSILILDDDAESAAMLQSKLIACHANADMVFSPLDTIQLLRDKSASKTAYDLFVVDVKTGLVDWREIIKSINDDNSIPTMKSVVLTSSGQRGFGDIAKELGVIAYLTKPIDDSALLAALNLAVKKDDESSGSLITRYTISEQDLKQSGRILLVDNNRRVQKDVTNMLLSGSLRSDVAESVEDALGSLNHIEYSMIMVNPFSQDINLEEFIKCVRIHDESSNCYHPVIALIDEQDEKQADSCKKIGVDDVLVYPFSIEQLNSKIISMMSKAS